PHHGIDKWLGVEAQRDARIRSGPSSRPAQRPWIALRTRRLRCVVTQWITHRAAAGCLADRNQSLTNRTTDWPSFSTRFHGIWRRLVLRRWAQSRIGSRPAALPHTTKSARL